MKIIITILLSVAISSTVIGQKPQREKQSYDPIMNYEGFEFFKADEYYPSYQGNMRKSRFLKFNKATKHRSDSLIHKIWNSEMNMWEESSKKEYIYDVNENVTRVTWFSWPETASQWYAYLQKEYTYDAIGNRLLWYTYTWEDSTSQWDLYTKSENTWDAYGNIILWLYQSWEESTNQWINKGKSEYTPDASGNIILELNYDWDESISEWHAFYKKEYDYDGNGNMVFQKLYITDQYSSQWYEYRKMEYNIDGNGNTILKTQYLWNSVTFQWDLEEKIEFSYDTNKNPILELVFEWEESTSQWVEDNKYEYTYNESYDILELILPSLDLLYPSYPEHITNMPVDMTSYYFSDDTWNILTKGDYFYSEVNIGISELSDVGIKIFPNPAKEKICISVDEGRDVDEVSIYTLTGQQVLQKRPINRTIDISDLQPGMYIVEVTIENTRLRQKLLIQR